MFFFDYRICRNKRPGRLIFETNKKNSKSHRFYVLPLCEKSPIKSHRFCVLPPLKNHPSKPIGFVYSPLWKITVFGERLFRDGRLFRQIRCVWCKWGHDKSQKTKVMNPIYPGTLECSLCVRCTHEVSLWNAAAYIFMKVPAIDNWFVLYKSPSFEIFNNKKNNLKVHKTSV